MQYSMFPMCDWEVEFGKFRELRLCYFWQALRILARASEFCCRRLEFRSVYFPNAVDESTASPEICQGMTSFVKPENALKRAEELLEAQ